MMINYKRQSGFSAIMAIIYVVLFAILGTFILTFSTISSLNTSQSLGSMRAWSAAKSGAEWAVYQALNRPACTCGTNCCTTGTAIDGASITFTTAGLNDFVSTVSCADTSVTEASTSYCVYNLGVLATRGTAGDLTFVSRNINLSVTDAP